MAGDAFTLLGDALWLDFVNSARGRTVSPPDLLPDSAAFGRWCELQHLDPVESPEFPAVLEFRDRLAELAEALHDGRQPPGRAIAALNEQLARIAGSRQLTRLGGEWRFGFIPSRPLSALEALASQYAARPSLRIRGSMPRAAR